MTAGIVIAPFSNSDIRDWPIAHFIELIRLLVGQRIHLIGSANQFNRAAEIVRPFDAGRVHNHCGQFTWAETRKLLASADCVIGNNSGIAHLAASLGKPTICLFGGAHHRLEWGPRGPRVRIVTLTVPCAPCGRHRAADCPFALQCLAGIDAAHIAELALELMQPTGG
ncbi:glycosyltransferase family 9 protein [Sphingomonas nostoxanthinifaciens]|uniref:glycosyltransferase family 9 protein n=1 Tax=Sphingomonas nostoxanthinifaciens TaxID=2872652 RepID=UPI001CC205E3|nr:glycosyltransferase family 9 protein [Sphingomonas nostoxanthinifaciens]UAK24994.1 glycosyltransferase family 9 protein [Sphingomonas nostoxanthinifaciens]